MANPKKIIKVVKAVKKATQSSIAQKKAYKEKVTIPSRKIVKAAKQEIKANARGLKAANKIKSGSKSVAHDKEKNNYKYWDKAYNQFADHTGKERGSFGINTENALKFSKPARPNRVRGGSMGSKVNWPKGMK